MRHVSEIRKTLIFTRVLYYVGYKFAVQGGVMKVSKSILVVMKVSKGILVVMKAKRIENLYKLDRSTEVNHEVVIYEDVRDSSRLWHQRPPYE